MKHPCVFSEPFMVTEINPKLWELDRSTPFAAFQKNWRSQHCKMINPYGSESCPYPPQECAAAYLEAASAALLARKSRIGLFRAIAKTSGIRRADEKPLAREEYRRTYGQSEGTAGVRTGPGTGPPELLDLGDPAGEFHPARPVDDPGSVRVHGGSHRLQSIGSLLRGDGAGSRTRAYGRHEEQTTANNDGDTGDPVSPPSPGRVGDKPSPRDP